jgi:hypothetical protein
MGYKPEEYISCCGFYCKTCKEFTKGFCRGCKIGYVNNERDINKAKCKIKLCCYKNLQTCAECDEYKECSLILSRFKPETYSNKKCIQCLNYIKEQGYDIFIEQADHWKNHYGKLE